MTRITGICPFCSLSYTDDEMVMCDDCDQVFCMHCVHTITSEDLVCPPCFHEAMMASDEDEELPA